MSPTPSHYQQAIIDHVVTAFRRRQSGEPHRNLVVQATAGAGKTHTIRLVCEALAPLGARVDVVAFNSRVAKDASARLPSCARSLTLHAAGKRAWEGLCGRRFVEAAKVDASRGDGELAKDKTQRIVAKLKSTGAVDRYVPGGQVGKLVSRAKGCGLVPIAYKGTNPDGSIWEPRPVRAGVASPVDLLPMTEDTDAAWRELIALCEIQTTAPGPLIAAARAVLAKSVESSQAIIDFDDMVYLPAVCPTVQFECRDVVMVDELQDLDPIQRAMVVKMCASTTSPSIFVGVGDRRQAIYSWRGACTDSMDLCRADLDTDELPLSICYRCPTSHVALAREVAPEIEAAPGAAVGEVVDYDQGVLYLDGERCAPTTSADLEETDDESERDIRYFPRSKDFQPGDAVICRLNAPLISMAYALMRAKVPFRLLGKDFGRGVTALVEATGQPLAEGAVNVLRSRLARLEQEDQKARVAGRLDDGPSQATATLRERLDVLLAVLDTLDGDEPTTADLCRELESLFADNADGSTCVTLGTVHSAKGAEWDRVWVLDRENMRPKSGASPQRAVELSNIRFVSLSRAKQSLFFISSKNIP